MCIDNVSPTEFETNSNTESINISNEQLECLSKRLLPEMRKFFANETVRHEFDEWKKINVRKTYQKIMTWNYNYRRYLFHQNCCNFIVSRAVL